MTMKNICSKTGALSICLTLLLTAGGTSPLLVNAAQEPFVYPAKGQNQEQIDKDKYTCYTWAKGQTGFDPMQQQTTTAPQQKQGGAVKGAAGGAALGAREGLRQSRVPGRPHRERRHDQEPPPPRRGPPRREGRIPHL